MLCVKCDHKTTEKLNKGEGSTLTTETWTYTFKSQMSKAKHVLTAERPLPYSVGEEVDPQDIGLHIETESPV